MSILELNKKKKAYSDVELVEGVFKNDRRCQNALYDHCRQYFEEHYSSVFFADDDLKMDIFQEAFLQLWMNIETKKIFVENGELLGKDGQSFRAQLTTYFMSIAKRKYLEWVKQSYDELISDDDYLNHLFNGLSQERFMEEDDEISEVQYAILSECIAQISKRCNEILTKFYYEGKNLDEIMVELQSFLSKDALKTAKYKCMENLRVSANSMQQEYLKKN